jgi:phage anti-repressor protein
MTVSNTDVKAFLKKYTPISNDFIDDFFSVYTIDTAPGEFVVDLDTAVKWLNVLKGSVKRTLINSYTKGVDYKVKSHTQQDGRGKGRLERILLTPDAFKTLCMMSRTPKAAEVRAYFVAVEASLFKYRDNIMADMAKRIGVLERNQAPKALQQTDGVIYIVKASETMDSVFKIGRTKDLTTRLRSHGSAAADSLDVVYIYKTKCLEKVEACIKAMLKDKQYRKYKEVYQVDLALVKDIIKTCDSACLQTIYYRPNQRRSKHIGGYYAVLAPI